MIFLNKKFSIKKALGFAIFIFLFSSASFASNADDLKAAIHDADTTKIVSLLKEGVDPNEMEYNGMERFDYLSSLEINNLLLENKENQEKKLDPNKFLKHIIGVYCSSKELVWAESVKLAVEKYNADPDKIDSFYRFPSHDVIRSLLDNKKDPLYTNKVLSMISLVVPYCMQNHRDIN